MGISADDSLCLAARLIYRLHNVRKIARAGQIPLGDNAVQKTQKVDRGLARSLDV